MIPGEHEVNISFSLSQAEKGKRTGSVYYLEYRKLGEHIFFLIFVIIIYSYIAVLFFTSPGWVLLKGVLLIVLHV